MVPENLMYTKSHEWVKLEGGEAVVGITHFAQDQLGDLTFIELPTEGQEVTAGEEMGTIESVKAASEVYAPLTGDVIAVNLSLEDAPEKVNKDPYNEGWLIKIKTTELPDGLLSPAEYSEHIAAQSH